MKNEDKRSKLTIDAHFRKAGPHKDMKYDKKIVRKKARKVEKEEHLGDDDNGR